MSVQGKKPTIRQKNFFHLLLEAMAKGEPFTLKDLVVKAGYSQSTAIAPSYNIIEREGFQKLLAKIDDEIVLAKVWEVLLGDDKRSSLAAADMVLKLKDRYPAQKSKVMGMFKSLDGLEE